MKTLKLLLSTALMVSAAAPLFSADEEPQKPPSLWELHKTLSQKKFIDLTHTFRPGIPRPREYPDEKVKTLYDYRKDGYHVDRYTIIGQWGTHVDAPSHFQPGMKTLEDIDVKNMIAPLVVIDISDKVRINPDARLEVEDVFVWESRFGKIPEGAFVACQTNWQKRWPDSERIWNADEKGIMHFPGWSVDALKLLVEERNILAIGHETMYTDPGFNVSMERYPAQTYLHAQDRFQAGLLANLDQVPEYGALIVVTFPKPEKGSGFPARVFAILP